MKKFEISPLDDSVEMTRMARRMEEKMKIIGIVFALFISGCVIASAANRDVDNSPQAMGKREAIRKELCNKQHYPNVKFVRVGGKMEIHKVHIDISEKTAYECKF